MPRVVYLPTMNWGSDVHSGNRNYFVGFSQRLNKKKKLEHQVAMVWKGLTYGHLKSRDGESLLSPLEIAKRIWTTYQLLNDRRLVWGTSASTTIYDGIGHLITATVGTSSVYAVAFNEQGGIIGVVSLNKVNGIAANVSARQIGSNEQWICADAQINITSKETIANLLNVLLDTIVSIQVISTNFGFTACALSKGFENGTQYLLNILHEAKPATLANELALAEYITQRVHDGRCKHNISLIVHTMKGPFLQGFYDGNKSFVAPIYAAENVTSIFQQQCTLSLEAYAHQTWSVDMNRPRFDRDNVMEESDDRSEALPDNNSIVSTATPVSSLRQGSFFASNNASQFEQGIPSFDSIACTYETDLNTLVQSNQQSTAFTVDDWLDSSAANPTRSIFKPLTERTLNDIVLNGLDDDERLDLSRNEGSGRNYPGDLLGN